MPPASNSMPVLRQDMICVLSEDLTLVDGTILPKGTKALVLPQTIADCILTPDGNSLHEAWSNLARVAEVNLAKNLAQQALDANTVQATQSAPGLMSASDKAKLDGIAQGATNTSAPPAAATAAPLAHGTASAGTSAKYAREDHVHPSNNTDTHWTSHLYAGASNGSANAATTNGQTYLIICDDSTVRDRRLIKGSGSVTVTSDASGNITINGTDTNTTYANMSAATASAAGKAGLVPAPAAGAQAKYLRGDGTWQTPPDTNTIYSAATQAAAGLMSAADKVKLDGIAAGAQVNPNMALYLALTGGTMTGALTVNNAINVAGNVLFNLAGKGANATQTSHIYREFTFTGTDNIRAAVVRGSFMTNGAHTVELNVCDKANANKGGLQISVDANGVCSATIFNPPVSDNSTKIATTSWAIPKAQNRGTPAGYETVSSLSNSQTININSADCINLATSGAVALTFTPAAATQRAVKVLCLTASAATTLTISGAVWANNGSAPTWGDAGKVLVLLAHFVGGRVVLSVVDNTQ